MGRMTSAKCIFLLVIGSDVLIEDGVEDSFNQRQHCVGSTMTCCCSCHVVGTDIIKTDKTQESKADENVILVNTLYRTINEDIYIEPDRTTCVGIPHQAEKHEAKESNKNQGRLTWTDTMVADSKHCRGFYYLDTTRRAENITNMHVDSGSAKTVSTEQAENQSNLSEALYYSDNSYSSESEVESEFYAVQEPYWTTNLGGTLKTDAMYRVNGNQGMQGSINFSETSKSMAKSSDHHMPEREALSNYGVNKEGLHMYAVKRRPAKSNKYDRINSGVYSDGKFPNIGPKMQNHTAEWHTLEITNRLPIEMQSTLTKSGIQKTLKSTNTLSFEMQPRLSRSGTQLIDSNGYHKGVNVRRSMPNQSLSDRSSQYYYDQPRYGTRVYGSGIYGVNYMNNNRN